MSDALIQWNQVLMNNYGTPPVELVSGRGATVIDAQGRTHIDMLAGIAVNALAPEAAVMTENAATLISVPSTSSETFITGGFRNAANPARIDAHILPVRDLNATTTD